MQKLALQGGRPVRSSLLVFQQPDIDSHEIKEVVDTLRSGWLSSGPKVNIFLTQFLKYKQASYGVALNSCSSALFLALTCAGVGPQDEVITTPMTFGATANVIEHVGARVVFADCDPMTATIDPAALQRAITHKTKAVIVVHFAGRPCAMKEIMGICKKHNLILIEDCAHALEATYEGKPVGTLGDFGCFSFYATKNVCTGDGGMLITKKRAHAERAYMLAHQGMCQDAWKRYTDKGYKQYLLYEAGYKMNMMDMQAALGIHQLRKVTENWKKRKAVWEYYSQQLKSCPCILPPAVEKHQVHGYHLYTVLLDLKRLRCSRDMFLRALQKENIGAGVHYIPLHEHPYYRRTYKLKARDFPHAHWIGKRTISLNLKPTLSRKDAADVCVAFKKLCEYYSI